jgi:hypothetical protein
MRKARPYIYPYKTNQLSDEYWNALYVPLDGYDTEGILPKENKIKVEDTRKQFQGKKIQFSYVDPNHPYVKMLLANKVIIPVVKNDSVKTNIHEDA